MSEWKRVKLGEVCSRICSGGTPKSTCSKYYENGEIPWLNTKEVHSCRIYDTEKKITQLGLDNSAAKWIKADSVVVAMYGATAGNVAQTRIPLTTNQACCNLEINSAVSNADFVFYYLRNCYNKLLLLANGAAQQNLNAQVIRDFEIPLPPLPTQRKIAAVLGALDDKIENNRKICANLEAQAQALFKSWFVDFEPFGGKMPSGWKMGKLGDVIEVCYGKDHKKLAEGKIPVFGSGGFMRAVDRSLYNAESVLIPRKGSLNNIMYVNEAFWTVDTMFYSKMKVPCVAKYVFLLLKGKNMEEMNVGSAVPSMTTDILNNMEIVIPAKDALQEFDEIADAVYANIKQCDKESRALAATRDALLPKLMSGEIDVEKVEV